MRNSIRSRWDVWAVVVAGLVAALSMNLWYDADVSVGAIVLELWQVLPFLMVAGLRLGRHLSLAAALVGAVALVAATVATQIDVANSESSTAAVAFVSLPITLCGLVVVLWVLDAAIRRIAA